nr:hypothetical protein CFP56_51634 [Quercus suber]
MRNSCVFFWSFTFLFPQIQEKKARVSSHPDPCLAVFLTSFYLLPQTKIDFSLSLSELESEELHIPLDISINQVYSIRFD